MNRLYVLLAAMTVFAAIAASPVATRRPGKILDVLACLALLVGCGWSLREDTRLLFGSEKTTGTLVESDRRLLPENTMVTRFAYLVFPKLPGYFTHGTTDPVPENRLFDSR